MAREMINEADVDKVVGGSIIFSPDHTTCGRNCNNQCKVNDYNAVLSYIAAHYKTMSEKDMIKNMISSGLLTRL